LALLRFNLLALAGLLGALPVLAQVPAPAVAPPAAAPVPAPTVRAGVDLWRAGDWAGAVAIWRPFADQGDPDAMFNIGQAYKLGRALPLDKAVARDWYRKAALKNHLPAQANLGILLFQAGDKPEAARWLKTAADRGEMRAQYVIGVAHWNGDGVAKSMALAHAYLSRASAQGLSEATGALANLNRTISAADRAKGTTIAASLAGGSGIPAGDAPPAPRMTAAELNRRNLEAVQRQALAPKAGVTTAPRMPVTPAPATQIASATPVAEQPAVRPPAPTPIPAPTPALPVASATPSAPEVKPVEIPTAAAAPAPAPKPSEPVQETADAKPADKPRPVAKPAIAQAPPGWRVQLGAFGKRAQAEAAWAELRAKQKAAIGSAKPIYEPGASIIKLQMGPYKTRAEARDACAKIAFGGRACFATEAAKP